MDSILIPKSPASSQLSKPTVELTVPHPDFTSNMFSSTLLILSVALSAVFAGASTSVIFSQCIKLMRRSAPFDKRQVGNAQCTLDRLQIVVDFAEAQRTVRALTVQLAS